MINASVPMSETPTQYQLRIVSYTDATDMHVIATRSSKHVLKRIEDGANINLDHERYYTEIVEVTA